MTNGAELVKEARKLHCELVDSDGGECETTALYRKLADALESALTEVELLRMAIVKLEREVVNIRAAWREDDEENRLIREESLEFEREAKSLWENNGKLSREIARLEQEVRRLRYALEKLAEFPGLDHVAVARAALATREGENPDWRAEYEGETR